MAILNSTILDSAILVYPLKLTHTCQDWVPPFAQKKNFYTLPSPPFAQKDFTHSFWLNLMKVAILNSVILDSVSALWNTDTLLSPLRFTQKLTHSTLTLTQTNLIWLKLIHSYSTWWWQPSWILPSWIKHLHCEIHTPCYLLSDLLENTLTPFWLWLKLI